MDIHLSRSAGMAACLLLALTGCGGGGGGSGSGGGGGAGGGDPPGLPLTLTITQNPITASVTQMDLPSSVRVSASVRGTTSVSTVYVVVADPNGTFAGVASSVSQTGASTYQTDLPVRDSLSIGAHSGTLTISACGDPQCNNLLGRTNAPYTVTITENPVLTGSWSPGSLSITTVQGYPEQVSWPASFTSARPAMFLYARMTDAAGVVRVAGDSPLLTTTALNNVALEFSTSLTAGTYTGNLDLVFCRDRECGKMYRGVTRLPYTVTVAPMTNLKPLAPLAGATDWTTLQGSSAHTGYVPVTLNPANFSPRWLWLKPDPANLPELLDVVAADGKVITINAPSPTVRTVPVMVAIDEQTGTVAWQQSMPDIQDTGQPTSYGLGPLTPPAIEGGHVHAVRMSYLYPTRQGQFMSFQLSDGTPRFAPTLFPELLAEFGDYFYERNFTLTSIGPGFLTPANGSMLLAGDVNAGWSNAARSFVSLDTSSGARTSVWSSCPALNGNILQSAGTVAVDANGAVFVATDLGLVLADTCETISSVPIHYGFGPTVVPGTSDVVAVGGGNVVAFDTAARQVRWSAPVSSTDAFVGSPAIAGSTLYVQNSGRLRLEARNVQDGQVLWTWEPGLRDESAFVGNVLATQNLVFVSTRGRLYAIDTTTHETAWIFPYGGALSLSANGVLHIRRKNGPNNFSGGIAAINLH